MKQATNTLQTFSLTPGGNEIVIEVLKRCNIKSRLVTDIPSVFIIGSRFGESSIAVAQEYGCHVTGIDDNPEYILHAKMKAHESDLGKLVDFKIMSPIQMDLPDSSIDFIIIEGNLNNHPKLKMLKECYRILKQDGKLAITDSFWKKIPVPQYVRDVWETREFRVPTIDELKSILNERNFEMIWHADISTRLQPFYQQFIGTVQHIAKDNFSEMKHLKSLVTHYKHEIGVFTQQSGYKWMGYMMCMAEKI